MADENETLRQELRQELEHYANTFGIYEQIISIQSAVSQILGVYIVVTGGLWTAVVSPKLDLAVGPKVMILLVQIFASLWLIPLLIGNNGAVRTRFLELEKIHAIAIPCIKKIGESTFSEVYNKVTRQMSWGNKTQRWFWFVVPGLGAFGSLVLLFLMLSGGLTAP